MAELLPTVLLAFWFSWKLVVRPGKELSHRPKWWEFAIVILIIDFIGIFIHAGLSIYVSHTHFQPEHIVLH